VRLVPKYVNKVRRRLTAMTTKTKKTAVKKTSKKTTAAKRPAATPAPKKHAEATPVAPANKPERVSMWGTARELIQAGKTNGEVLAMLRERFALPQEHSFYAVWYRSYAVKHGVVTKEFAKAHAGPPVARKPATA
jgi:hypothetical protein